MSLLGSKTTVWPFIRPNQIKQLSEELKVNTTLQELNFQYILGDVECQYLAEALQVNTTGEAAGFDVYFNLNY